MKRTLKELLFLFGFIVDSVFDALPPLRKRKKYQNFDVVIVKFDALGDLFISLSFIHDVSRNDKVLIIADEVYLDLLKVYGYQVLPVNKLKYIKNLFYRFKIRKIISKIYCDTLINLNISRPNLASDSICSGVLSRFKTGFMADRVNSDLLAELLYKNLYSRLIDGLKFQHELEKLSAISEAIKIESVQNTQIQATSKGEYFLVALGAGQKGRSWAYENLVEVIRFVYQKYRIKCFISGSNKEVNTAKKIVKSLKASVDIESKAGMTSVIEYVDLVKGASFVISNESSAIHIANFYHVKSFCILGGGHYGRFVPYPTDFQWVHAISYKMDCYGCNWNCKYVRIDKESPPCINGITAHQVIDKIQNILQ